ncbi:hypothetical protein E2C01_098609 [Portunus trituberculatus]|uniref:Uncharacterized protein n=1 Tax=Portunus trituberculatus TaxID=210409 RepID=A0A5B7K839_PORTR|nr:hypothetical protein [Portunus trituberculatus]
MPMSQILTFHNINHPRTNQVPQKKTQVTELKRKRMTIPNLETPPPGNQQHLTLLFLPSLALPPQPQDG